MAKVAAILGFSLVSSLAIYAQQPEQARARKFDEFGVVGHCDVTARLDNLAIQLQNRKSSRAAIVSYGPEGEAATVGTGKYNLEFIKAYLLNTRGITENQLEMIYGGRNSDLTQPKIELWVLPKGAAPPKPEKHHSNIETFQGLFVDEAASDDFGIYWEAEMEAGIPRSTDASFADLLHQQRNAVGHLVVYSGEDLTPGAWRKVAQDQIDHFKQFNLEASRFKIVFGGQQKETRLQMWLVPNGAPSPVPDAGTELPPTKSVKAGDFYFDTINNARNQTAVFTRLTEILKTESSVRALIVVRLEQPTPDEPGDEIGPAAVEPITVTEDLTPEPVEEVETVDLTKLVEKWRQELISTHKINPDRLITLFVPAKEMYASYLSLWIVPKGQPLPDPNEDDEQPDKDPQQPSPSNH